MFIISIGKVSNKHTVMYLETALPPLNIFLIIIIRIQCMKSKNDVKFIKNLDF